ncbi:MAG: hypothetical protein HQK79_06075 [Desulfobacterales bacterium]|nr:hypothetical protein [Desulfobacterales bacterium]
MNKKMNLIILALIFSYGLVFSAEPMPSIAPLNPEFLKYQEAVKLQRSFGSKEAPKGYSLGYIPSPIQPEVHNPFINNLNINKPIARAASSVSASDAKYDLRDPNNDSNTSDSLLTPVKNQGSCGVCWTFASYASLEGYLKKTYSLSDNNNDYSEDNMKHRHDFVTGVNGACSGGNFKMATAYLVRKYGPISESDDPYDASATSEYCTNCTPVRYVDNAVFLPVRSSTSDNTYIKQAIIDYGALYTSMYWNDQSYNSSNYTYYDSSSSSSNHAVVIVGWDDNKVTAAQNPGAFIVRNSWGTSWGESGYFYISYYDTRIAFSELDYFIDNNDSQLYFETIYQYDPLGYTARTGYGDAIGYGANIFTPQSNGYLKAVGFYAVASNLSYEIKIYDNFNGTTFSTLLGSKSGTVSQAGYYTIPLDSNIRIIQNDNIGVVVKFDTTTSGYTNPIPLESPVTDYAAPTGNSGESYISHTGGSFTDVNSTPNNRNVCIKAFADNDPLSVDISSITANPFDEYVKVDWETASERGASGFYVLRSETETGSYIRVNSDIIPSQGSDVNGAIYNYLDYTAIPTQTYYYRLEEIDTSGKSIFYGITAKSDPINIKKGQLAVDFGEKGVFIYNGKWVNITKSNPMAMGIYNDGEKFLGKFSNNLYEYDGSKWTRIATTLLDEMINIGPGLYVDFGTSGLYKYYNGWSQIAKNNPDYLSKYNGKLVAKFSGQLYEFVGNKWNKIATTPSEDMIGIASDLYVDFGASGLYRYNKDWSQIAKNNPERLSKYNGKLVAKFSGQLYEYVGNKWNRIATTLSENMIDIGSELYVDFGSQGLYKYNGKWIQIAKSNPLALSQYNGKIVAKFSDGLYEYDGGKWLRIATTPSEDMIGVKFK